ncbi:hypothetical protein QYF36_012826 [Acer negundo]|nr:hypothetical protein QYF36_012826 [Acer negundo]
MALPNFDSSKILSNSDITKPALPTETARHMIPLMNGRHFLDLMAADIWGQQWPFRYYTRPNGNRICPVFATGWHQYVEAKGADGEPEMRYMIRVTRPGPVTFNGEPLTMDVEYLA